MSNLRDRQIPVIRAALEYVQEPFTNEDPSRFARIIMPARTGKTRIAADITAEGGGVSVFLAPTQAIVEQAAKEYGRRLPGQQIHSVMAGRRDVGIFGHVCSTYHSLLAMHKAGEVPELIRSADYVFADEAHKAMTELRQGLLRDVFKPEAVRIALTSTPDYDEERALVRYFPDLIHEMSIREGVEAGLMAPYRAEAFAVEIGETDVKVLAGEFEAEQLGLAMSHPHMLKAAAIVRYAPEYRNIPALITCASRKQAFALAGYLNGNRPKGASAPGVAISGMEKAKAREAREAFDARKIDTLITVGMLIEGWDAPHCKLLIDLSPAMSWVRSAQKYSRVMTKVGQTVAYMVVLIPSDLSRKPVMPKDVFGPGLADLSASDPIQWPERSGPRQKPTFVLLSEAGIKVDDADIIFKKISSDALVPKPEERILLDPRDTVAVRSLLRHNGAVPRGLGSHHYSRFAAAMLTVDGVRISGDRLLKALGYPQKHKGFKSFVAKYYPGLVAEKILVGGNAWYYAKTFGADLSAQRDILSRKEERESTASRFLREFHRHGADAPLNRNSNEARRVGDGWIAVSGGHHPKSPDEVVDEHRWESEVSRLLDTCSPMETRILRWRLGLDDEEELTLKEIGDKYSFSRERIRQLQKRVLAKLRGEMEKADQNAQWKGSNLENERLVRLHHLNRYELRLPRRSAIIRPSRWESLELHERVLTSYRSARELPSNFRLQCRKINGWDCAPYWCTWKTAKGLDFSPNFGHFYQAWIEDSYLYCYVDHPRVILRRFIG